MRLTAFLTSFVFIFALGIGDADARKRFGGGGSKGTFSRQVSPPPQATPRQAPATNPAATNAAGAATRGGMGGMLMGVMAGGLLGALIFGGVFEGIQLFDIVLIALVVGGLVYFMRSRRRHAEQQASTNYAYADNRPETTNQASSPTSHYQPQPKASAASATNVAEELAADEGVIYAAPAWFNEEAFLQGARQHFLDLQQAWAKNDLSTMQEYVTPQLYKFLLEERAKDPGQYEPAQVQQLAVELSAIQQLPSKVVELAIMFHGQISEDGQPAAPFCEIWHLIRDMNQEQAPWLIQGIEQVDN